MTSLLYLFGCLILCSGYPQNFQSFKQPLAVPGVVTPSGEQTCLRCICEASSNCSLNIGCSSSYCGPYLIGESYWIDGGQLTLPGRTFSSRSEAFLSCVSDIACASQTIRNYFQKYSKDCTGDGVKDCYDIATMHKLGGYGCEAKLDLQNPYWSRFNACYK